MSADWLVRWAVIAAIFMSDAIWIYAKGITLDTDPLKGLSVVLGLFLAWGIASSWLVKKWRHLSTILLCTSDYFYSLMQLILITPLVVTLTYLTATLSLPLADTSLMRADMLLGFDWQSTNAWVSSHHLLARVLFWSYATILWQPLIIAFFVSVNDPGSANGEFIWNFLIGLLFTTGVFAFVPAIGYEGAIGPHHIAVLRELRANAWTTLELDKLDGIVTFPSFHATLGILFPYCARRIKWLFWVLTPLNGMMILSTPTGGALSRRRDFWLHYRGHIDCARTLDPRMDGAIDHRARPIIFRPA